MANKRRTINTDADWGIKSYIHFTGGATITFESKRHKINVKINDDQIAELAEAGWKLIKERERQVKQLRDSMGEP